MVLTREEKLARQRESNKKYREKNPERIRAMARERFQRYRARHPERVRENVRKQSAKFRERNPQIHSQRVQECKRQNQERLNIFKVVGCARCPEKDFRCLDFHHIDPSTKSFTIGKSYWKNIDVLTAEVKKCEVLCANCHRKEHN